MVDARAGMTADAKRFAGDLFAVRERNGLDRAEREAIAMLVAALSFIEGFKGKERVRRVVAAATVIASDEAKIN